MLAAAAAASSAPEGGGAPKPKMSMASLFGGGGGANPFMVAKAIAKFKKAGFQQPTKSSILYEKIGKEEKAAIEEIKREYDEAQVRSHPGFTATDLVAKVDGVKHKAWDRAHAAMLKARIRDDVTKKPDLSHLTLSVTQQLRSSLGRTLREDVERQRQKEKEKATRTSAGMTASDLYEADLKKRQDNYNAKVDKTRQSQLDPALVEFQKNPGNVPSYMRVTKSSVVGFSENRAHKRRMDTLHNRPQTSGTALISAPISPSSPRTPHSPRSPRKTPKAPQEPKQNSHKSPKKPTGSNNSSSHKSSPKPVSSKPAVPKPSPANKAPIPASPPQSKKPSTASQPQKLSTASQPKKPSTASPNPRGPRSSPSQTARAYSQPRKPRPQGGAKTARTPQPGGKKANDKVFNFSPSRTGGRPSTTQSGDAGGWASPGSNGWWSPPRNGQHGAYNRFAMTDTLRVNPKGRLARSRVDPTGYTALHYAASMGYAPVVQELLKRKKSHVLQTDSRGLTPRLCAMCNGHTRIAEMLKKVEDSYTEQLNAQRQEEGGGGDGNDNNAVVKTPEPLASTS